MEAKRHPKLRKTQVPQRNLNQKKTEVRRQVLNSMMKDVYHKWKQRDRAPISASKSGIIGTDLWPTGVYINH